MKCANCGGGVWPAAINGLCLDCYSDEQTLYDFYTEIELAQDGEPTELKEDERD